MAAPYFDPRRVLFSRRYGAMLVGRSPASKEDAATGESPAAPEPLDFSRDDVTFDRSDITFDDTEA